MAFHPREDTIIGKATERLFLYPIKLTLQPDITDIHMPPPGVAHNLVWLKSIRDTRGGE
ncbi:MAG: UbiD family decarboxylase [Bacteroidales bacterium]